jgi:hypothetical protein
MKKILSATFTSIGIALLSSGCIPTSTTGALNSATTGNLGAKGSTAAVTYINKTYGFSFTIPAGWNKMSGNPNSKTVLFTQVPISNGCSFQFHIASMGKSFPAKTAVRAAIKKSKEKIATGHYISAKARHENGTRGWQVVEKGKLGAYKRIIYQAYDAVNHHFTIIASANTEKFDACQPDLEKIINSVKFN